MNSGQLHARLQGSGAPVQITWHDGRITELQASPGPPPGDLWIAPTLLDLQVNGYAGVDFQQDDLTVEHLLQAARGLRRDGCTQFLLTLITDAWPRLTTRLRHLARLRASHPELQAAILGWHLEGPFLSAEPGYCGAHDPACMIDPTPAHVDELLAITGPEPLLLTMAPERPGAIEVIHHARRRGVFVQLGHTNAPAHRLAEACGDNTHFTHLGNACPQQLDRHDNILWRVLDQVRLGASLIPDGLHVAPELFRLIHRIKGDRVYYTTDAMSAAGAPPGRYRLGRLELEVGADGIVRQPGKSHFAGSSCTPVAGVFRAARMLQEDLSLAWARFSAAPARALGREWVLTVGGPADFCVLNFAGEAAAAPRLQTCVGGVLAGEAIAVYSGNGLSFVSGANQISTMPTR